MPQNDPAVAPAAPKPPVDPLELLAVESLRGDVRDFLLDRLKHDHSALPWNVRGEEEQQRTIDAAETAATELVRKVYLLCMEQGRPTVLGKLAQGKIKGEKLAVELQVDRKDPLRHAVSDAIGKEVLLVLTDSDAVMGERGRPKPSPDQPGLFGGDDGDGDGGDDEGPVFDNTPSGKGH